MSHFPVVQQQHCRPAFPVWLVPATRISLKSSVPAIASVPGSFPVLENPFGFSGHRIAAIILLLEPDPSYAAEDRGMSLSSCGLFTTGSRGAEGPPCTGALTPGLWRLSSCQQSSSQPWVSSLTFPPLPAKRRERE